MAIDEIEVPGNSISLQCSIFKAESIDKLFGEMGENNNLFDLERESPGFHDCDSNSRVVRGFYSLVSSFEVEHLIEGISTLSLLKRIESCEFLAMNGFLFSFGKLGTQKVLFQTMSGLTGFGVRSIEYEFLQMSRFHERLSQVKAIVITNPKDKEIRRARLAGRIESYTDYNILDPLNHGIENVSGLIDGPLGPMNVTVGRKGSWRIGVRKGFILTLDCLLWLNEMIQEEKPPSQTFFKAG
ncbi:hypothetical protein HYY75_03065 [bacterium]|nr:hypothetical protein [bacterium]